MKHEDAARSVRCPHCEAVVPNYCREPSGRRRKNPHKRRLEHYIYYNLGSQSKLMKELQRDKNFGRLCEFIRSFRNPLSSRKDHR